MDQTILPSINQLFAEAWALTKSRFWSVLFLWLVQGLIVGLIIAAVVAVLFTTSLGAFIDSGLFSSSTETVGIESVDPQTMAPILGIVLLVLFIAILVVVIIGPMFQAATIALIASEEKIGVGAALKRGWKKFLPVVTAGFLMAFFVLGGLFLFVIPGIAMAVLLSFVLYEIVLYDVLPMQALRNSAGMVWKYFWPLVGRMLVLMALAVGISMIIDALTSKTQPLLSLISLVINLVFSVFSMMYSVVLYKGLRAAANGVIMTLTAPAIISVVGWVGLVLLIAGLLQTI